MNPELSGLRGAITKEHIYNLLIAIAIFFIGSFVAARLKGLVGRSSRLQIQQRMLLTKIVYYGILFFATAAALGQIGVDVRVLLGAAGVLTVAVGFAAQTSASNLISGIFLMIEKPFVVGDIISIGDTRGEVLSIDLVSSKIRTFNNLLVRIPNETMVKSNIVNYSYFPIRRIDFNLSVGHDVDLQAVETALRDVARAHPLCLVDPQPVFHLSGLTETAINIQFQIWSTTENLLKLQNEIYRDVRTALNQGGFKFPTAAKTLSVGLLQPAAE